MKKLKVAITGGIGSGKTEFSKFITEKGYLVISADKIAKEVLINDENVKRKIINIFGKDSYLENDVNTKYLAEKVFTNEQNVKKINSIVHPVTITNIESMMKDELQKEDLVFVEAALIFEADMSEMFDYIILLSSEKFLKIERIKKRDNVDEDEILARMSNQLSEEEKKCNSDFIIQNDEDLNSLKSKAETILTILKSISLN